MSTGKPFDTQRVLAMSLNTLLDTNDLHDVISKTSFETKDLRNVAQTTLLFLTKEDVFMIKNAMYFAKKEIYDLIRSLGGQWNDAKERPIVCFSIQRD